MDLLDAAYQPMPHGALHPLPEVIVQAPLRPEEALSFAIKRGLTSSLASVLSHSVGFHMFKEFMACHPGGAVAMDFIQDVCRFKAGTGALQTPTAVVERYEELFSDAPYFYVDVDIAITPFSLAAEHPACETSSEDAMPAPPAVLTAEPTVGVCAPTPRPPRRSLFSTLTLSATSSVSAGSGSSSDVSPRRRRLRAAAFTAKRCPVPPPKHAFGVAKAPATPPPVPSTAAKPPASPTAVLAAFLRTKGSPGCTMNHAWSSAVGAVQDADDVGTSVFDGVVLCLLKHIEKMYFPGFHQHNPFCWAFVKLDHWVESLYTTTVADLSWVGCIGKGGYGDVYLARRVSTGHQLAVKCMPATAEAALERRALEACSSPFITTLRTVMETGAPNHSLLLAMDFCSGGDIGRRVERLKRRHRRHLSEADARFYAAEVLLALQHLHERGIMHRDLKPCNVLIGGDGHVVLGDLGLAAFVRSPAVAHVPATVGGSTVRANVRGLAGTPGFLAPEILAGGTYDAGADFWSFGALVYTLLCGATPFPLFLGVSAWESATRPPVFPQWFSPSLQDLLTQLFVVEPSRRLGCSPGGFTAIKQHPFFAGVDWDLMAAKAVLPPWVPRPDAAHVPLATGMTPGHRAKNAKVTYSCPRVAAMEVLHNVYERGDMEDLKNLYYKHFEDNVASFREASTTNM